MTGKRKPPLKRLSVEYVLHGSIKPNAYNANRLGDREFELLRKSIAEDGYIRPILVNKATKEIIDGEHTWRAAGVLGHKKVPVQFTEMTPEQARIATLRINRARGEEDHDLVAKVLREIEKMGAVDMAVEALLLDKVDLAQALERADKMFKDVEINLGTQSVDGSSPLLELAEGDQAVNHGGALAKAFLFPPFSVLNAREGAWQDRKRQWLALGIKSGLGRGGALESPPLAGPGDKT